LVEESRRPVVVALNKPMVVVVIAEDLEGVIQVVEGSEGMNPKKLLFEGAPEPLDATVALRCADEGGAAFVKIRCKNSRMYSPKVAFPLPHRRLLQALG
jgi:hypothetical protein